MNRNKQFADQINRRLFVEGKLWGGKYIVSVVIEYSEYYSSISPNIMK